MFKAKSYVRKRSHAVAHAGSQGYTPDVVAELYHFPTVKLTTDPVIAILELGGGYVLSDVQAYFASLGLPAPVLTDVSVRGATNSPGSDADVEVVLDIFVAAAAYSKMTGRAAQILMVFAPNDANGIGDAIEAAADHASKPAVLSCSWGQAEDEFGADAIAYTEAKLAAAASKLVFYAAAGDNGANDNTSAPIGDYPGTSQYAVSCGGTSIQTSNGSIISETVWNNGANGGATGGGFSQQFPVPAFQAGVVSPGTRFRGVPDLAADADPDTGYNLGSRYGVVGGTSAVAPLMAAYGAVVYAVTGKQFSSANFYPLEKLFNDITVGNNNGYSATIGWDPTTGCGSVNGVAILNALAGTGVGSGSGSGSGAGGGIPTPPPTSGISQAQLLALVNAAFAALEQKFAHRPAQVALLKQVNALLDAELAVLLPTSTKRDLLPGELRLCNLMLAHGLPAGTLSGILQLLGPPLTQLLLQIIESTISKTLVSGGGAAPKALRDWIDLTAAKQEAYLLLKTYEPEILAKLDEVEKDGYDLLLAKLAS